MTIKKLCLAATALWLTAPLLSAAIPPAENLLPSDTLAFFSVPDCTAARVTAKSSPGWRFWGDPAMKPFHDKVVAKWDEQFIAPLERDLGVKADDFTSLPQGQLTLAITVNGATAHGDAPPGLLLLLDAKDQGNVLKTNLAALVKKWTDAGRALRTETVHGLAFTVVPLSSNDFSGIFPKKPAVSEIGKEPAKPEKPGEVYFAQFETLFIAGNALKVVEPVAAHLTGGSAPAIADNAVFAADKLAQFRENPEYYAWFNGKAFFDLVAQAPATENEDSPSPLGNMAPGKIFGALGFDGLKSASFAVRETREGSVMTIHLTAPESARSGLLKMLAIAPQDASVPPFVPADAVKFSRFRLDGKQTWAELQKTAAAISPVATAGLNSVITMANTMGQQKNPAFDLRNDLFGNLKDDIITYQKPASGDSLSELSDPPTLFLVAVANADSMINAIRTLASLSNPQSATATPRDFMGRKIYSIPLKSTRVVAGTPQPRALYISASNGYLALSADESILEEFLRSAGGQAKPLRENPGLLNAMQYLGGAGGGIFGYENQRETMRLTFRALKSSATADSTVNMFPASVREWLDFSLLPDFDSVSKYFYLSTFTGTANSGGMTFKVFAPRPPTLN